MRKTQPATQSARNIASSEFITPLDVSGEGDTSLIGDDELNHLKPVFKGCLVKRNWYNNKQLREFHLLQSGIVKYYLVESSGKLVEKGYFTLCPKTKLTQSDALTLNIYCEQKKRTYVLMQPDSNRVDFKKQQERGNNCFIKDWNKRLQQMIDQMTQEAQDWQAADDDSVLKSQKSPTLGGRTSSNDGQKKYFGKNLISFVSKTKNSLPQI
uniref:PH domain-containing protein n=1 Tax=Strombidium rassoulzadegani TaxID=1082188 RepID=A0A7S3CKA0_9SPIT|mmetsp:Transcript_14232/g.24206  ORF Transcript_14232/g.24206 Transcript_14232/m.24206 type:complete len:211 (+) Transcript_14232:385-1017(+)